MNAINVVDVRQQLDGARARLSSGKKRQRLLEVSAQVAEPQVQGIASLHAAAVVEASAGAGNLLTDKPRVSGTLSARAVNAAMRGWR